VLRADHTLCAEYEPGFLRLTVPMLALGGADDPRVRPVEIEQWRERLIAGCTIGMVPGGHFFPCRETASVVRAIAAHPALVAPAR
jgi:surfactin synthase thioesterase subunit